MLFACKPCYQLFPTIEDGISHVLGHPAHATALQVEIQMGGQERARRYARNLIVSLVEETAEASERTKAESEAQSLVARIASHANQRVFRVAVRAAVESPVAASRRNLALPPPTTPAARHETASPAASPAGSPVPPESPSPPPGNPTTYRVTFLSPERYIVGPFQAAAKLNSFNYTYSDGDMDSVQNFRAALKSAYGTNGGVELNWRRMFTGRILVLACGIRKSRVMRLIKSDRDILPCKANAEDRSDGWVRSIELGTQ